MQDAVTDDQLHGEDRYRARTAFDTVSWGSHCADCFPSNCRYHVFVRDGKVVREEVAGPRPGKLEPGGAFPDAYPQGCNKGAAWSRQLDAGDRLLHPLRRVGPRGSGEWERISWDEALDAVADGLLDAIDAHGPSSILREGTPEIVGSVGTERFVGMLGATTTDLNASISDFAPGIHLTMGKSFLWPDEASAFESELVLLWHTNPVYTYMTFYHYFVEARYKGAELVLIAPDVSPSHMHVDYQVPVRTGSDAALTLAMCQVILEEELADEAFVRTQTDLSLLVRTDTERFLRAADLDPAGRDDQFFHLDESGRVVEAARGNLLPDGYVPQLTGTAQVALADGSRTEVRPLMVRLRDHLGAYRPEDVAETTGIAPSTVRMLARKVATRRTKIWMGMSANKAYHSDLYQRTMLLLLALTGNWGRPGSGYNNWASGQMDGWTISGAKARPGVEGAEDVVAMLEGAEAMFLADDPTSTPEIASFDMLRASTRMGLPIAVPPAFLWYWHAGFRELWNRPGYGDPAMTRSFDDYLTDALAEGWWDHVIRTGPDHPPRVLIECGGNIVRRTRGGRNTVLEHLWPNLDLVVTIDLRMSSTALWSDIVLPAAQHYEKVGLDIPLFNLTMTDESVPPAGESLPEWEIFRDLTRAMARRAAERGIESYPHPVSGAQRYADLPDRFTLGGALETNEQIHDEIVRDAAYAGMLPPGTDLATLRQHGQVRFEQWGGTFMGKAHATDWPAEDEIANPLAYHVERGDPYPTLTRRAQFLIEHPWFVEVGEDLPVHKDMPAMGGEHTHILSSGHNRWSVHAMNMGNPLLLETHRGEPHVVINPTDADAAGIADHDRVRVFNDVGSFVVRAKLSGGQQPGAVTVYNGWDPHMFAGWGGPNDVSPGMVKHLNLAAGYGHVDYAPLGWQPVPVDRGVRVSLEPLGPGSPPRPAEAR
jgi:DMSO reductase family type II enzyme molybdopterin subunit